MNIRQLFKKKQDSVLSNEVHNENHIRDHSNYSREYNPIRAYYKYIIIRKEDSNIISCLNDLTEAVNNMINSGWKPLGNPNVKRDSTKTILFVAFQAMVKVKGENG